MSDLFRFIGDTANGMGYVYGEIYFLDITVITLYPKGTQLPRITNPITCPYGSWEAFFENWERV